MANTIDTWFSLREHEDVVGIKEMLNGMRFVTQLGTQDKQQFHLVFVKIGTNVRDWVVENTLMNHRGGRCGVHG